MAATPLCEAPLAALKKSLRDEFPHVQSSHLSEALAYSLGFRTYAAMLAAMAGPESDRPFVLLSNERMCERLVQLCYDEDPEFDFELTIQTPVPGVVSTMPISAYDIEYKSPRDRAWRNLMVCATNAALEHKLFTLRPGDNRFGTGNDPRQSTFDFTLPNGLPARGQVSDAGFNEVAIYAAVNPKVPYVRGGASFDVGDAVGMTWIERERGAWMQSSNSDFRCRRHLLAEIAGLEVAPLGYGDRGGVIM